MNAFATACPKCGKDLSIDDSYFGKDILCPHCNQQICIPLTLPGHDKQPLILPKSAPHTSIVCNAGKFMIPFGTASFIFFGFIVLIFIMYDTSSGDVHNQGLINNRTVGIIVSCGGVLGGLLCILIGHVAQCSYYLREIYNRITSKGG